MHESGVVRSLVAKIELLAHAQGARRVTAIRLCLGALSHMTPDHFRDHFRIASAGTIAEAARLDIELSDAIDDPNAQGVLLRSFDIEEGA